ncbi:4-alpha-glucanotransferase [Chloroflexota bacterium]
MKKSKMRPFSGSRLLHLLARLYGVQTAYYDVYHLRKQASTESLLAVLRLLGAPITTFQDIPSACRERQQALWQRPLEPVVVAWNGEPSLVEVRLPLGAANAAVNCHLKLETGEELQWEWHSSNSDILETAEVEGIKYAVKHFLLPGGLPWGYHRLVLELLGSQEQSLVISAPIKAYNPPATVEDRSWGVFLPLYSLYTKRSWGSGDFSDLEELMHWVSGMGGRVVATLPLLATFLDESFDPSPYLPASRFLWNEFYLNINRVSELRECSSAQTLLASPVFKDEIESLRNSPLVNYQRQMILKRKVLEELSHYFFSKDSQRLKDLHRFAETNPVVEDYAQFCAVREKQRTPWRSWPQPLQGGVIKESDYDEKNKRYHLYVQWLVNQQMEDVSKKAIEKNLHLYLDLPLGVHPDGYDVWRERGAFILDTSAGAPPDAVFTKGQNWAFPPLHPEKTREQGYRYVIAYLRHHFRHAGILRIDHVMGLHRLFCIPNGMETNQGVYLRYRAEELYAILSLESYRHRTVIVGEDLGTVPPYVRRAMRKHALSRMYVAHYELASNTKKGLPPVSRDSVASLNTHDMPPFASFWQGLDIEERLGLDLLDKAGARREKKNFTDMKKALVTFLQGGDWLQERRENITDVLKACLSFLAASQARMVLLNLEDLWLETRPQNVPSTRAECPNWRRKSRYALEEFCQMPQVVDILRTINKLRKRV